MENNSIESSFLSRPTSRRQALKGLGLGSLGLASIGALAQSLTQTNSLTATNVIGNLSTNAVPGLERGQARISVSGNDVSILIFALNLEYLEAEFYTYATTGNGIATQGISVTGRGTAGDVTIRANPQVTFTTQAIQQYALEIAANERAHVSLLQAVLGFRSIARPAIDLQTSFTAMARAAGLIGTTETFDPFADELSFLLAAFLFEDMGVTTYRGALPRVLNRTMLSAAAGILGTEAYQAAIIRTKIFEFGTEAQTAAQQISDLRDSVDDVADVDQGVTDNGTANVGTANIVPTDANGLVFARTARQILNILYLGTNATAGGFFPGGINTGTTV